jgi:glucokinase
MTGRIPRSRYILAGDVGGTNTRLGVFQTSGNALLLTRMRVYRSRDHSGLEKIVDAFLGKRGHLSAACFGVAGPVISGTAVATNLPWRISVKALRDTLSIGRVFLINDLVANAYGIAVMKPGHFSVLNRGKTVAANRALLSAGTGLGASILFWDGKRHVPSPSEGGHVEFGPKSRLEMDLLQYLFDRFGHVSYERVLSGAGLFNIYQFLRDNGSYGIEPGWLSARFEREDPAAVIAGAARLRKSRLCAEALDLFVSIYGAAAGNLALQCMARGGVYLGGGIAPKIVGKLRDGTFMRAFKNKGRLSPIVEGIPVRVIMNDQAALLGAAAHAVEMSPHRDGEVDAPRKGRSR